MLCRAIQIESDKSQGLFQKIDEMQRWRNLVAHASPYDIPPTIVTDTAKIDPRIHEKGGEQYAQKADKKNAKTFYSTALEYIELIKTRSGIDPRTSVSYKIG